MAYHKIFGNDVSNDVLQENDVSLIFEFLYIAAVYSIHIPFLDKYR